MYARAARIAGHLLTIDDCHFLIAIDQKNKDLQSVILALPEVSRIFVTIRQACRERPWGALRRKGGFFSAAVPLIDNPDPPQLGELPDEYQASCLKFRINSRPISLEAG
jgi:hypothetical protein